MIEYIEREALLEQINDDCKYAKASNDYQRGCNEVCDWAIKTIKNIPTADVVPRAEVEKRLAEYQNKEKCVYAYDGEVMEYCVQGPCPNYKSADRIKQEVAREIFAEIDKHIQEKKKAISMFKDGEDDFYDGEIHALEVFAHLLAEIKKKYTEEGK